MRVVVQRVSQANVKVENKVVGSIGPGLLVYVGIEKGDSEKEVLYMAEKILNLRIFSDKDDKMNLGIMEIKNGAVLSISQFTLASNIKKGRRPDFTNAMNSEEAKKYYHLFNEHLAQKVPLEQGIFGAKMDIFSINDGPVTFIIEKTNPT